MYSAQLVGAGSAKSFEVVFTTSGRQPLDRCCATGSVARIYDRSAKGFVLTLSGGRSTKVLLPQKKGASLGLTASRPFLVMQIYVPLGRPFTTELVISDEKLTRRRLVFSTAFKDELFDELHAQLPLHTLGRGKWTNFVIDMLGIMGHCFGDVGQTFRVCDSVAMHSICKLRNIFCVRENPHGLAGLPSPLAFPNGVDCKYCMFDVSCLSSNDGHFTHFADGCTPSKLVQKFGTPSSQHQTPPVKAKSTPSRRGITRQMTFGSRVELKRDSPVCTPGAEGKRPTPRNSTKQRIETSLSENYTPQSHGKITARARDSSPSIAFGSRVKQASSALTPGRVMKHSSPSRLMKEAWAEKKASSISRKQVSPVQNRIAAKLKSMRSNETSPTSVRVPQLSEVEPSMSLDVSCLHKSPKVLKRTPIDQALTVFATPPGSPTKQKHLDFVANEEDRGLSTNVLESEEVKPSFEKPGSISSEDFVSAAQNLETLQNKHIDNGITYDPAKYSGNYCDTAEEELSSSANEDVGVTRIDKLESIRAKDFFPEETFERFETSESISQKNSDPLEFHDCGPSERTNGEHLDLGENIETNKSFEISSNYLNDVQPNENLDCSNPISNELATKQALLEEKRKALLELERAYLDEFGEDEIHGDLDNVSSVQQKEELVCKYTDSNASSLSTPELDLESTGSTVGENDMKAGDPEIEVSVELIYDPVLACYFDPSSGKYYEIQHE